MDECAHPGLSASPRRFFAKQYCRMVSSKRSRGSLPCRLSGKRLVHNAGTTRQCRSGRRRAAPHCTEPWVQPTEQKLTHAGAPRPRFRKQNMLRSDQRQRSDDLAVQLRLPPVNRTEALSQMCVICWTDKRSGHAPPLVDGEQGSVQPTRQISHDGRRVNRESKSGFRQQRVNERDESLVLEDVLCATPCAA